jgi:ribonuclease-3
LTGRSRIPGIDYRFSDERLLSEALTHRSRGRRNNERLEFLGDSVLSMVVSERLYQTHGKASEGDLSRMRARLVRGETLSKIARKLELGEYLKLGEGELKSGGYRRPSILANTLEAIIGAMYLDGGFKKCRAAVLELVEPLLQELPDPEELKDPKTRLQEWVQARGQPLPQYELVAESGADHRKQFQVRCSLPGTGIASEATGSSRRKAQQSAARLVLDRISQDGAGVNAGNAS